MDTKTLLLRWSWQVLAFILLVIFVLAVVLLREGYHEDLSAERKSADEQIQLIASILSTELGSGRYDNIDKLFKKLALSNNAILELRLDAANGFNLASFKRPSGDHDIFEQQQIPISYSYREEATFAARLSLEEVYQRNMRLFIQAAILLAVVSMMLSYLLYMAIRLQNEVRRSRRLSNLYKALSEINQAIVRMEQQAEIFPLVCRCAVEFGGMSMAFVAQPDEKSNLLFPAASYGNGQSYLEGIVISSLADVPEGRGPTGIAYRENRAVIVNDYLTDPITAPWKQRVAGNHWHSAAAFPIPKGGRPFAVLSVYHSQTNAFDEEAIALLYEMSRDITFALENFEREKQRIEANESLKLAASVFAGSSEGIMITDADNRIISVNPAFTKITGYSLEEVIERNPSILSSGHHDEAFYRDMWQSIESTGTWQGEIWDRHKNGEIYPKWLSISAVKGEDGIVTHYIGSNVDITERQRIQIQTDAQLRRYQALMQNSLDGIHIMDTQGNVIEANDSFCKMLGYTQEEACQLNIADWNSQYSKEELLARLQSFIGKSARFETVHRRKDGTLLNVEISTTSVSIAGQTYFFSSSRDITDRKVAEEEIKHLAFYDHLTHLPNRLLLMDRLNQALASSARSGRAGALLFIDLDNFKNLNDSLGHAIGDVLLQQVTQRLESCIREGDTVARLGGDEFVVMLLDLSGQPIEAAAQTESIGEKILAALSQPYQLDKHTHRCTASIGVTLFSGSQQPTDELMKQSDIAMYQAKKAGRNTLRFFDRQMQENISARVSLESELHNAIEFQQFHLHYQVQVDSSNRALGAEALIRWIHPVRGLVSPAQFILLAEETGLILPIGLWVLETACAQIKAWQQDKLTCGLVLAVNVSAKQFHQADFVAQVIEIIQRYAINPKMLKLELTEGMLLDNIEFVIATMNQLNEIGVRFSLDDFGTGYSSLQHLKRLPLNQLKIDQSFVRDIDTDSSDKAIVSTIIAMAQILNMDVIAEGVETEEQRQFLLNNGCSNFQGYLFSRPVPIEQFEVLLKQS